MSCNHCGTKFNFFHKEMGCSNCGLSFCNKCLKQKGRVPNKGPTELPICKTCLVKISQDKPIAASIITPPDAYFKRLAGEKHTFRNNLSEGLSSVDQELYNRLEKLKQGKKDAPPSEVELNKRLRTLKGENEYVEGPSKQTTFAPDLRSDQEKVDSLLRQFTQETEIELAHNPEEGIVTRLANLREKGVRANEGSYVSNLHDSPESSDGEVDKITKKIMDEVALEEKVNACLPGLDDVKQSEKELPWCVLCNEDAVWRCLDCDDLYCSACNSEIHKTWGDTDHKVVPYKLQTHLDN